MIKRYGLGAKAEKITAESVQFGLVGIVERPDGEYYKAADVDAILESIGAGGVTGNVDALDAIIAQCEKVSNRLGFDDHQEAVLEGELTLAEALRASAWEMSLIGTLAKNLKEKIQQKTVEQHRAEFEEWLLLDQTFFDPDRTAKILQDAAWEAWKAARGVKE